MQRYDDDEDDFEQRGLLRDGRSYRVPLRMADAQRRRRAQDSSAFPRPRNRCYVTDAAGSTMGLHKPGYRVATGGHAGDQALRDGLAEETERARDSYVHQITSAWKRRDAMPAEADDDAEVESRAGAIRNSLLSRGHDPGDVEDYLNSCDDDELLDQDIGQHIAAFEANQNGRDARSVAAERKTRLDALYQQRHHELANEWRKGK